MNFIDHDIEKFQNIVSIGDEVLMVLKAHMMLERSLWEFLSARLPKALVNELSKSGNFKNFKTLIMLARSVASQDQIPISNELKVWKALDKINTLRNQLAHHLEPDAQKITKQKKRNL